MKIKELNLYSSEELLKKEGIETIQLSRLSNVVALVGRNGSGKTRILNVIEQFIKEINYESMQSSIDFTSSAKYSKTFLDRFDLFTEYILNQKNARLTKLIKNDESNDELKNRLKIAMDSKNIFARQHINRVRSGVQPISQQQFTNSEQADNKFVNKFIHRIKHSDITALALNDGMSNDDETILSFETLLEKVADNAEYNELSALYDYGMKFLIELPAKLKYDMFDTNNDDVKFKNRTSHRRFMKLKSIFEKFIGKTLDWESKMAGSAPTGSILNVTFEGTWKVNGRIFNYNEFSDGEKSLFGYVLLFFLLELNPTVRLSDSIILIDEPELHLHPESEIDLIEGVRALVSEKGQLWIATHSLSILSHLNQDEIYMVKESKIYRPSESTPENSLNELMGLEDKIFKLSEFVTSISNWSYTNFMVQCFNNPDVIAHSNDGDPQIELFKQSILSTNSKTLLDFGAGKGRLFERLKQDEKFGNVNYSALEPYEDLHPSLNELGVNQIYSDYKDLPVNTFDHIVLCNVLHEITLSDWIPTLNKIIGSLKETGFLIVIEDRLLPKGEKIDVVGFLLMDIPELVELFGIKSDALELKSQDERYKERIMCAILPKQKMAKQINKKNLISALGKMQKRVLSDLKMLRESNNENKKNKASIGRKSALYSQLYCNACLALLEIETWE